MLNVSEEVKTAYKSDSVHKQLTVHFPDLGTTYTNVDIVSESLILKESIMASDSAEFIGCIASTLSLKISGLSKDIKGAFVEVTITDDITNVPIPLFHGYVDSAKKAVQQNIVTMEAYDVLYSLASVDVTNWYNTHNPCKLSELLEDLLNHVGVAKGDCQLLFPDNQCYCGLFRTISALSALDLLKAICQFNGCFGRINRNNEFELLYIDQHSSNTETISYYKQFSFDDYAVRPADAVVVRDSENDKFFGETGGGKNKYIIQGNPFIADIADRDERVVIAQTLLHSVSELYYTPFSADINGLPYLECGDRLVIQTAPGTIAVFTIITRELRGISAIRDKYNVQGNEYQNVFITDLSLQVKSLREGQSDVSENYLLSTFKYVNDEEISIPENDETVIFDVDIVTTKVTDATCLATVTFDVFPRVETINTPVQFGKADPSMMSYEQDMPVVAIITYYWNDLPYTYQPIETWTRGKHTFPLIYFLESIGAYINASFRATIRLIGGTAGIAIGNSIAAVMGQGFKVGDRWDGKIRMEEKLDLISLFPYLDIPKLDVSGIADSYDLGAIQPHVRDFAETIPTISFAKVPIRKVPITTVTDRVEMSSTMETFEISVARADTLQFDRHNIGTSGGYFNLVTRQEYTSEVVSVDSGRLLMVDVPTTDKLLITSLEVTINE